MPRRSPGRRVRHAITLLWEEIHRNMAMLGITDLTQLSGGVSAAGWVTAWRAFPA